MASWWPYFVSECGGIWRNPEMAESTDGGDSALSWGFGQRVRDEEEFHPRFTALTTALTTALMDNPDMFGYCYTQLTDVFRRIATGPSLDAYASARATCSSDGRTPV